MKTLAVERKSSQWQNAKSSEQKKGHETTECIALHANLRIWAASAFIHRKKKKKNEIEIKKKK